MAGVLAQIQNDARGFHADLASENAALKSSASIKIVADQEQQLHCVLKNETSGMLTKVYWKTKEHDFCEENSIVFPIVSNDSEYREYSYPIGMEMGWKGTIIGIKVLPVFGHTSVGKINFHTIELRKGEHSKNRFQEILNVKKLKSKVKIK